MDKNIINKINSGEIPRAVDLRDKLKVIAKSNHKNQKKFVYGDIKFEEAFERSQQQGFGYNCFERIHTFRKFISEFDIEKKLANYEKGIQDKCLYELKKIHNRVDHLEKRVILFISKNK